MPPVTSSGKSGTIKAEEFAMLTALVAAYGPEIVVQKVGKICKRKAEALSHEYSASSVAAAYSSLANKINVAFGGSSTTSTTR